MKIIKTFEGKNPMSRTITLEEIMADLEKNLVSSIYLSPKVTNEFEQQYLFVDSEHPITTGEAVFLGKFLAIDENYFKEHKKEIMDKLCIILSKINTFYISIPPQLITDEILNSLLKNPNIKVLRLGYSHSPYTLTPRIVEMFKNTSYMELVTDEVSPELKDNFDPLISYNIRRKLIEDYRYEELNNTKEIIIKRSLTDEEIDNFKYISPNTEIIFKHNDYDNIFKTINKNKNLNLKYTIISQQEHEYDYKNKFNEYLFTHPDVVDNNITIGVGIKERYPISTYLKYEKLLYSMIQPALNLSPFEKFLYAYNVTKKYKKYKGNADNPSDSRNLYSVLEGEYMVCRGFTALLNDLLNKLGIDNYIISATVDIGYDRVPYNATNIPEDAISKPGYHSRLRVNIVDPKYDIDGFYISDPTWDNVLDQDTYNFSLITEDDYSRMYRYNYTILDEHELLSVHSLEEFYSKVNIYLDKELIKKQNLIKTDINSLFKNFQNTFKEFMSILEKADHKNYEYYNKTYKNLYTCNKMPSNAKRFITRMENVIKKNNNPELTEKYEELKRRYGYYTDKEEEKGKLHYNTQVNLIISLLKIIKLLDIAKYNELNAILTKNMANVYRLTKEEIANLYYLIGEYILSKVNKPVTGDKYLEAITLLYRDIYGIPEDRLEFTIRKTIEENRIRQIDSYPPRVRINKDGTKTIIQNESNIFDLNVDKKAI